MYQNNNYFLKKVNYTNFIFYYTNKMIVSFNFEEILGDL